MSIENGRSDTKGIVTAHFDDNGNQYVTLTDKDGDKLEIVNGAVKTVQGALSPATDGVSLSAETMHSGRLTVTTAGTKVQITTTSTPIVKLVIQALKTNTNDVVFGGSGVVAAVGTRAGNTLEPGDSADVYINDLTAFYLDAVVSGEGIIYNYYSTAVPTGE